MILKKYSTWLLLLTVCHTSRAWTIIPTSKVTHGFTSLSIQSNRLQPDSSSILKTPLTSLFGTSSDDNVPKRKRKRKKKVQVAGVENVTTVSMDQKEPQPMESEPTSPVLDLKPREDVPVQLEVKNILASSTEPEPSAVSTVISMLSSITGSKDTSTSGESTARASSVTNDKSIDIDSFDGQPLDDSLDQLLKDVRLMTEEEKEAKKEGGGLFDDEGTGVKEMIGNALSNLVTADFFVVCGFLLWFLLGIFCSYILKDDTVQIAFNNQFETLVQPALGFLMIAAIGGSFFQEEEQEYDL